MSEWINVGVLIGIFYQLLRIERRLGHGDSVLEGIKKYCPIFGKKECPIKTIKEVEV